MSIIAGAAAVKSGIDLIRQADDTIDNVNKKYKDTVEGGIRLKEILKGSSLVEASSAARVEPITLVEQSLVGDKLTEEALSVALNAYASFYVMTASLVSSNVNGAAVVKTLDKLNPNRNIRDAIVYSGESHDTAMRLPRSVNDIGRSRLADSLEARTVRDARQEEKEQAEKNARDNRKLPLSGKTFKEDEDALKNEYLKMGKETISELREKSNMAVGKLVEVSLGGKNNSAGISVFINFRLSIQIASDKLLEVILVPARNRTFSDRVHAWRAGEISFWRDLVFMRDVVDHHRKQRMADTKGLRRSIDKRMAGNRAAALVSREGSLNMFSSIGVITRETARNIEQAIGGKLDNFKVRNAWFEETGLMMLMVVDRDYKMVDIYYHSIPEKSEMTEGNLRQATKGTGPDVNAIMEALLTKAAPSF